MRSGRWRFLTVSTCLFFLGGRILVKVMFTDVIPPPDPLGGNNFSQREMPSGLSSGGAPCGEVSDTREAAQSPGAKWDDWRRKMAVAMVGAGGLKSCVCQDRLTPRSAVNAP